MPVHALALSSFSSLHAPLTTAVPCLCPCVCVYVCVCACVLSVVIDRTAEFVRKTGSAGEEQLLAKNRNNRKFAFLTPQSPYHSYFRHRLTLGAPAAADTNTHQLSAADEQKRAEEAERAEKTRAAAEEEARRERAEKEAEARRPATLLQRLQRRIEASRLDGEAASTQPSVAAPQFRIPHPSHYSSSELDVVHLTALYDSHLGGGFVSSLHQRERTNAAFDFLKPQHPLYAYYVGSRQAMERILRRQTGSLLDEYRVECEPTSRLLARLMEAARRRRAQQVEEEARQREAQEDTEVMAAIDWQAFVVVETIDFTADEAQYLPQPKRTVSEMEAMIAELAIEEEREREERERLEAERRQHERREQEETQLQAAAAAEAAASLPAPASSTAAGAVIEHSDEQLEVRMSAVPTAASVAAAAAGVSSGPIVSKLVTCVVCGDTIAAEDLEEHLRIELLDPRWKEQKQLLIDRQRETSLVAGKSISDNLRRFERKKREIARERSREEEERQEKDDALLLRGAAREDHSAAVAQPSTSSAAMLAPSTSATAASSLSAPVPSSPPLAANKDEPLHKRARPTSPGPGVAFVPSPTPTPSASPPVVAASATLHSSLLQPSIAAAARSVVSSPSSSSVAALGELPSSAVSSAESAAASSTSANAVKAASAPQLVDEAVWLSAHPLELTVTIRVPPDVSSPYRLTGQELSVACRLTDGADVLKAAVSERCNGVPANRQQLQLLTGVFLKESHSLAYYNVYDGAVIALKLKERGGKRR